MTASHRTPIDRSDPIPTWKATQRKMTTLATVLRLTRRGPRTLEELDIEIRRLVTAAMAAPTLLLKIRNLWKIEGLVFRFFERHDDPELSLRRSSMPPAAGPPAHCGLAMAVVMREGFDSQRLLERFEIVADPTFAMFCHETTGLMLAIADSGVFGSLIRTLGPLGMLRHQMPAAPERHGFFASLSDERSRLAGHGYGRALYFKTLGFSRAVSRIEKATGLPTIAMLRGLGSANSLINCRDLERLLDQNTDGLSPTVTEGLDGGLFNTLCLLEWSIPGSLAGLNRRSDRGTRIIKAAEVAARSARDNGSGPPMVA